MRRPTFMCIVLLSVVLTAMSTFAADDMKTGSALDEALMKGGSIMENTKESPFTKVTQIGIVVRGCIGPVLSSEITLWECRPCWTMGKAI